jgi:hypothetical protein
MHLIASLSLAALLGGCGPSTVVVADAPGTGDGSGDTAANLDSGDTGGGGDSGGDMADTGADTGGDTGDTAPPDDPDLCFAYGLVAGTSASFAYGASVDSYDAAHGPWSADSAGSAATVAVNGSESCALTNGATVNGTLYVGLDPAAGYCEVWGASVSGGVHQLPAPAALPTVAVPAGRPASQGDVTVAWEETRTFAGDETFDTLTLAYGSTVEVTAPSTLVVGELDVQGATLTVQPGASLTVYVKGNATFAWGSTANADGEPAALRLLVVGGGTVNLADGATLAARVVAPDGAWTSAGTFSGNLAAATVNADWGADFHLDDAGLCP